MKQADKSIHGDGVHDDTNGIQALLDSGVSFVYLPPPKKEYLISRPLLIHSQQGLRLDPYTGIRLAPQKARSYSAMIANADQEEGNENISVTGGVWDMDNMRQPINPVNSGEFAVSNGSYRRDFVRAIMDFHNVSHLALKGLILKNASQLHIRLGKVSHFTISDIRINTEQAPTLHGGRGVGVDGIGLYDGDCHWGFISNIQGKTLDDFISINPDNGPFTQCRGPVEDIDICDIHVSGQNSSGIRLLSSGSPIRNIRIRNFNTASAFNVLQLSNFKTFVDFYPNDAHGVFENISLENVTISSPDGSLSNNRPEAALIWIESGGQVSNLSLKNICRTETTRSSELVHVDHGAEVDWLNIDEVYYSNTADRMLPLLTNSGRIRHLTLQNAHINSKPGVFGSAVINTGTIDDCRISEVYSDCANKQIVYHRGGDLPPGVTDANLVHDFPAHGYGFQYAGAVELIEDPHIDNQFALTLKDQVGPFPISVGAYVLGKSEETFDGSCVSIARPSTIDNGKYQWVDCGEQMLFYSGRRIALCLGSTLPAYKQNALASTHEIEFSIPPLCRMPTLPRGLYRMWANIKTDQQPDGKYAISLSRVTLINQLLPIKGDLSLSGEWTVFTSFDKNDPVPASDDLSRIPEVLRIAGNEATTKRIDVRSGHVDFSPIWGGICVNRTGYVYIQFRIETAGEYTFGFGADWWYQAWIDGKPLSDTLDAGNGSQAGSLDHLATVHLDPGNHLIVVRFISGSSTSLLYVGGPSDIRPEK